MRICSFALAILLCSCSDDPLGGGVDAGADSGVAADTGVNVPSFTSLYEAMSPLCSACHAPGAPGRSAAPS